MIRSNIKNIMEARGVTLKRMAMETGLAEMTLIRARREQIGACRLDTLLTIADYLECKLEDLFTVEKTIFQNNTKI